MIGEQPRDPELTYSDPKAYILYLRTRGMNPAQIDGLVRQRFGAGETPEQRARREAGEKETAGYAQVAGQLGGTLGGAYLGSQLLNLLPGATSTGAIAQPTLLGGTQALGSTAATTTGTTGGATTVGGMGLGTAAGLAALGSIGANQLWENGMKDIVRGRGTREDYINTGLMVGTGGLGGLPNLALRLAGKRSIGKMMTTGKSDAQQLRDDFRSKLKETGVADDNYHVTLADGTKFNIGLDGKNTFKNVGENIDGKTTRRAYDIDFSNPLAKYAASQIDPMIRNIYGPDAEKAGIRPEQYTGILVNAATSNAKTDKDVLANIQTMLGKSTFAQQAGVGVTPPPPAKAPQGQVVRVSPGMYVNDKGHVGPAKTVRQALETNYQKSKGKK
jgi:hypothetical protein